MFHFTPGPLNISLAFPSQLEPGDQILAVNGEDVKDAPRDHVIQLVRNCETSVTLLVCQPQLYNAVGRKSTLLSAGKKAKLKSRPIRVRFAESVCVNGAPLFPVSIRLRSWEVGWDRMGWVGGEKKAPPGVPSV